MEKAGVITITICSTAFQGLAALTMRGAGIPDLIDAGLVIMGHPFATLTPEQVDARATELFPEVERLLNLKVGKNG